MKKQQGFLKYVFLVFAFVIIVADACLILMHDKTFSENENRVLQQVPELSIDSLVSGRFMTESENFVADQFFVRDQWIQFKVSLDRLSGRTESGDVLLGKDGYLLEKPEAPTEGSFEKNLASVNTFASAHDNLIIRMAVIPNVTEICKNLLPTNAPVRDQSEDLSRIEAALSLCPTENLKFVNVSEAFSAETENPLYYKSDHHWTSCGAKLAWDVLAPEFGIDLTGSEFQVMTAANDFSGTMASSSGCFNVKDSIEIYIPTDETLQYIVEYAEEQTKSATIFSSAALERKNKYEVFLDGNHPQVNIKTTVANNRNLLLLKDSYANALVQFLLPHFHTITIVDPRYYSDDLNKIIEEKSITDVLILYNMNTFAADNNLAGVLVDEGYSDPEAQ